MLICFIGSPCSGKTTAAAALFSELKNMGYASEFIPEVAREHIMMKRRATGDQEPSLTKMDQVDIYRKQEHKEELYRNNCPNSIIISDGSTINSYFYGLDHVLDLGQEISRYDLVFFCENIERFIRDDNRVHDAPFSRDMEMRIHTELRKVPREEGHAYPRNLWMLKGNKDKRLKEMVELFKLRILDETGKE